MPVVSIVKPKLPTVPAFARPTLKPTSGQALAKAGGAAPGILQIATEFSEPIKSIEQATFLIYGNVKIGKTTLVSRFLDPYFLFFEPGGKWLRLKRTNVPSWNSLVQKGGLRDQLLDSKHHTIVIDTADRAYDQAYAFAKAKHRWNHPNDLKWGEGWGHVNDEFKGLIDSFSSAGKTLIFMSHAKDKEFQSRQTGSQALMETYSKIVPSLGGIARTFIEGFVDVFAFYGYFGGNRYFCIRDSEEYEAGTRLKENFRTTTGKQVRAIPMYPTVPGADYDEEDAYKALVKAFNNQQTGTGEPTGTVRMSNIALKPPPKVQGARR